MPPFPTHSLPVSLVQQCLHALCAHTPPHPALLLSLSRQFATPVDLCAHLLRTRWTPTNAVVRLRHFLKHTGYDSMEYTDEALRRILRTHFRELRAATRFVVRHIQRVWTTPATPPVHPHQVASRKRKTGVGVVVTTHGNNGVYVRRCIASFYRSVPTDRYDLHVVLYINEPTDALTPTLREEFPQLTIVRIADQDANGGLTGTWNQGIDWCFAAPRKCQLVVLSNDDLFVMSDFRHLLHEAEACRPDDPDRLYFGPVTNNPGPSVLNRWQLATQPEKTRSRLRTSVANLLNGFLMVFPAHVLRENRFDKTHYFDPSKPFAGNELEWGERFFARSLHHRAVVVPHTFVYHTKLQQWKTPETRSQQTKGRTTEHCIYTVNIGQYESNILLRGTEHDCPVFYFTDSETLVYRAIEQGLEPMLVDIRGDDSVRTQRAIKTAPHRHLPLQYTLSAYVDGNCVVHAEALHKDIDALKETPDMHLVCWAHPNRTSIHTEAEAVRQLKLERSERIDALREELERQGYTTSADTTLTETNLLLRRHHEMGAFADAWTACIQICRRDQLSFDFLVAKHGVSVRRCPYASKPIQCVPHSGHIRGVRVLDT